MSLIVIAATCSSCLPPLQAALTIFLSVMAWVVFGFLCYHLYLIAIGEAVAAAGAGRQGARAGSRAGNGFEMLSIALAADQAASLPTRPASQRPLLPVSPWGCCTAIARTDDACRLSPRLSRRHHQ